MGLVSCTVFGFCFWVEVLSRILCRYGFRLLWGYYKSLVCLNGGLWFGGYVLCLAFDKGPVVVLLLVVGFVVLFDCVCLVCVD